MSRRTLDPKLDIVFKLLFGRAENRALLTSLLDAVLEPAAPIRSVEVQSELDRESVSDKGIALDLRVELANGEQVDVEMQTQPRPAGRQRALYYWARLYADQLRRGRGYDQLHRCVVVQILAFRELRGERFHTTFRLREIHDGQAYCEHAELHLLELPKLGQAAARNEEPRLVGWGKFLSAVSDEQLEELAMTDSILRDAKAALERLSEDPDARVLAQMRDMALRAHQMELATVRSEGEAEGKAQGKAQGYAELLLRLLAQKFGAVPASVSERVERATAPELQRWADRVLEAPSLDAVFDG